MRAGRLAFTTELGPALEEADGVFIAVGTPSRPDGAADLSFVRQVAESIGHHLNGYKVVITKSTVPIGTGQMIEETIRGIDGGRHEFAVVSNPEFLREGSAIEDFMHPDRVVIGSRDQRAIDMMLDIYSPLRVADVPFVVTDVESAELIKYASNGFLATKISFINEVATLCEVLGADVEVVARGMGLDNRIGPKFLNAGPGFGGSCFPKDTRAVAQIARDHGETLPHHRRRAGGQRGGQEAHGRQGRRGARRRRRQDAGRPRPGLQAGHRRHPRVAGARRRGRPGANAAPVCAASIPRR